MNRFSWSGFLSGLAVVATMTAVVFWDGKAEGDQEKVVAHDQLECSRCHDMVADIDGTESERNLTGECLKCHQLKSVVYHGITLSFHESPSPRCQNCHNFHETNAIQASSRTIKTSAKGEAHLAHCVSCHQNGMKTASLSIGHREAVSFYHSSSKVLGMLTPSEGCLVCHSNSGSRHFESNAKDNLPRFSEMASHPYGIAFKRVTTQETDSTDSLAAFEPLLIDGRIECQTCHLLTSQRADYLAGGEEAGELCAVCHDM